MLFILGAGALWGLNAVFVTELASLGSVPSLTSFLRMFFAFLIVAPIAAARHSLKVSRRGLLGCALLGLLCHAPFNLFFSMSVEVSGVALASVLTYSAPVFTALASRLLFRERITPFKLLALAANILGCCLAVTGGNFTGGGQNFSARGILLGLAAGFCYGMTAIVGKFAGKHANPFAMSAWSYAFTAAFLLAVMRPPLEVLTVPLAGLGFLYGLIGAALPYLLYYAGLSRMRELSRVPVLTSIEPITATLLGVAVYHESLSMIQLGGVALVIASIVMMCEQPRN